MSSLVPPFFIVSLISRHCRTMTSRTTARTISIGLVAPGWVFIIRDSISRVLTKWQRAGMKGTSYTYFTTDNAKQARELIGILRESKSEVPPELEQMAMFSGGGGGGRSLFSRRSLF